MKRTNRPAHAVRVFGYVFLLIATSLAGTAQPKSSMHCQIGYENRNQIDYGPVKLKLLSGTVVDPSQSPISGICVGIFTEKDHRPIASAVTNEHGGFTFPDIAPGAYRFVVIAEPLCPANVPIEISPRKKKGTLKVLMKPRGIEECSHGKLISAASRGAERGDSASRIPRDNIRMNSI